MAVENIYQITVNTKKKMFRDIPEIVANDNIVFEIEVYEDAVLFPLLDTYSYQFVSKKLKGNPVIRDANFSNGLVRVELGTSEMTVPGKVEGTLQIFDEDMKRISTAKFDYVVKKDPSMDGDLPNDERNLVIANESLLVDAIEKSKTASTNSTSALTKATSAESKATTAETTANNVRLQLDNIVMEGDSSPAAAQAAVDAKGVTKSSLKKRLDDDYNEVSSALAENESVLGNIVVDVMDSRFGAVGNGIVDDSDAFIAAAQYAKTNNKRLYLAPKYSLRITKNVNLRAIKEVDIQGEIKVDFNGIGLTLGSDNNLNVNQLISTVLLPQGGVGIRVIGAVNSNIKIGYCLNVQLYADSDLVDGSYIAYNSFYLGRVDLLEFLTNPSPASGNVIQWINENKFFGGRLKEVKIDGTYQHNNNIFYSPVIEHAGTAINIQNGHSNHFIDCRCEYAGITVSFGVKTRNNTVEVSFMPNVNAIALGISTHINLVDYGAGNFIDYKRTKYVDSLTVFEVNTKDRNINGFMDKKGYAPSLYPGIDNFLLQTNWSTVFTSDFIPIDGIQTINYLSDKIAWNLFVYCYDSNKQPIAQTDNPTYIVSGNAKWYQEGYYREDVALSGDKRVVVNKDGRLKYVKLVLKASNVCPIWFNNVRIWLEVLKYKTDKVIPFVSTKTKPVIVTSAITSGIAELGEIIPKTTGGYYQCTLALSTTVTGSFAGGSTTIGLTSNAEVLTGDVIGIQLDNGATHWTKVTSNSGTVRSVETALPSATSSGKSIFVSRWV
jgi:hypothetical protein